jgi:hypothetical protein
MRRNSFCGKCCLPSWREQTTDATHLRRGEGWYWKRRSQSRITRPGKGSSGANFLRRRWPMEGHGMRMCFQIHFRQAQLRVSPASVRSFHCWNFLFTLRYHRHKTEGLLQSQGNHPALASAERRRTDWWRLGDGDG